MPRATCPWPSKPSAHLRPMGRAGWSIKKPKNRIRFGAPRNSGITGGHMAQSTLVPTPKMWSRVRMFVCLAALVAALPAPLSAAAPDPVLEWMQITNDTVIAAGTSPLFTGRQVALVSSAVFDAVNGIERRFQPIHVTAKAPHDA